MLDWSHVSFDLGAVELTADEEGRKPVGEVSAVLDNPSGSQGIFAALVYSENLVQNIGLDDDNNQKPVPAQGLVRGRSHSGSRMLSLRSRADADDSAAFSGVRRIGKELQAGLLALLYEPSRLLRRCR